MNASWLASCLARSCGKRSWIPFVCGRLVGSFNFRCSSSDDVAVSEPHCQFARAQLRKFKSQVDNLLIRFIVNTILHADDIRFQILQIGKQRLFRAALQLVASRMLSQRLQESPAESELLLAIKSFGEAREERRKKIVEPLWPALPSQLKRRRPSASRRGREPKTPSTY